MVTILPSIDFTLLPNSTRFIDSVVSTQMTPGGDASCTINNSRNYKSGKSQVFSLSRQLQNVLLVFLNGSAEGRRLTIGIIS